MKLCIIFILGFSMITYVYSIALIVFVFLDPDPYITFESASRSRPETHIKSRVVDPR
jgi:hypothetical protein